MKAVEFYGTKLTATVDSDYVVVTMEGKPLVDIKVSVPVVFGTNNYKDRREVVVSSNAIRLVFRLDIFNNSVNLKVELNL